jgi:hypothetical protein
VIAIWNNPEFIRNFRAQLRPGKMLATAGITAAISIALGFAFSHQGENAAGGDGWGRQLFLTAFVLQALMLAAGGGIACVNTIYREKDQNTFDFQRVTQMTPLELTVGKLFGAPVFTYFVCLCLMPLAIFGAIMGKQKASIFLAIYAVLLVGSLAVHMLTLLISLLAVRGSHTGGILLLLVVLWLTSTRIAPLLYFQIGPVGPFFAAQMIEWETWEPHSVTLRDGTAYDVPAVYDVFFGNKVQHVPVLIAVDLLFAGWFLLALVRNIKRDPHYYEIYSPLQLLGFAMFLNLLFVAFFKWRAGSPLDGQSFLLTLNMGVFYCFGLVALRNRERVRRILRMKQNEAASILEITWPAPLLILGTVAAGLIVVLGVTEGRDPKLEWNITFALLRSLFFAAWIVRDIQFLQWMKLRRGKHTLVMGILFQIIFYVCVSIMLGAFGFFRVTEHVPFTAFFLPSPVYSLDHSAWALRPAIWLAAFIAQWVLVAAFIALQRQSIEELQSSATAPVAAPVPAQT